MFALLVLIALILLYGIIYLIKCQRLPPGPYGLPVLGYYPFMGKQPGETALKLAKKYGDFMSVNFLGKNYWVLNSFDAIDEVYNKNGELFHGRQAGNGEFNFYSLLSSNCSGVLEGNDWKIGRKFTIGNLTLLGMGKSGYEMRIHDIMDKVEEYIDSKHGNPNDFFEILTNYTSNVLTTIVFGKQYEYNDPDYINIRNWLNNVLNSWTYMNFILSGFVFEMIHKINPKYVNLAESNKKEFRKYVESIMDERLKTFDRNHCNDLLDYFLKEMEGPNAHLFTRNAITGKIMEMMFAGTMTSSATLYHSISLMSSNPEVQERVHNEVNDYFGKERIITFEDKDMLPYTRAVISEIHRYVSLAPLMDPHFNREDTTFRGYKIPKRTGFIGNFYAVFKDPRIWKNPNEFDPNNFLDAKGNYVHSRALLHFGIGARNCSGFRLAETAIFIAFVRLMQRFQWIACGKSGEMNEGMIRTLKPYKVRAVRRE